MTIEKFKEELTRYYDTEQAIETMQEMLARLRAKLYYPKAIQYEKDRVQSSPKDDILFNAIQEVTDLENKIELLTIKLDYINRVLDRLQPLEKKIICLYYIQGMTLYQIAKEINYSYIQAKRIKKRAERRMILYMIP